MRSFIVLGLIICSLVVSTNVIAAERDRKSVQRMGDETLTARIKTDPKSFYDRPFIMIGTVRIADTYTYGYFKARDSHYVLRFVEILSTDPENTASGYLYLYLRRNLAERIDKTIIDEIVSAEAKTKKLVRVQVTIKSDRVEANNWENLELLDLQFADDEGKWGPWLIATSEKKQAETVREEAKRREEADIQELKRREAETRLALEKKAADDTRDWKDPTGKFSVYARFMQMANGKVTLQKPDGANITVEIEKLSEEDRQWLQKRAKQAR